MAWRRGVVAWARAIYQYHVNGTDTVGRLVGRSVNARGPVDHASVGLTQARPNNLLPRQHLRGEHYTPESIIASLSAPQ